MRCIVALALAALAVLGPLGPCAPAQAAQGQWMLPRLHSCCPRPAFDANQARLASGCCCTIEAAPRSVPVAPPGARGDGPGCAIVAPVAVVAILAVPGRTVDAPPRAPAASPPLTLFEHRVALLS